MSTDKASREEREAATKPGCTCAIHCQHVWGDQANTAEEHEIDRLKARLEEYKREVERRDELLAASSPAAIADQVRSGMDAERDWLKARLATVEDDLHDAERELDITCGGLEAARTENDRLLASTATDEVCLLREEVAGLNKHIDRMHSERDNALCVAMDLRSDREVYESVACGWAFDLGRGQ